MDEDQSKAQSRADKQREDLAELREAGKESNRILCKARDQIHAILQLQWPQKLAVEILDIVRKTYKTNMAIYDTMRAIKSFLPSYLERTLIEEPFILEDAIGRLSPVHLQFICSWEAFEDVMEHRFRDCQGYQKVLSRMWAFQELATNRDISVQLHGNEHSCLAKELAWTLSFRTLMTRLRAQVALSVEHYPTMH